MSTYQAILMTTGGDLNGNIFSNEVLQNILEQQPTVPVTVNFTKKGIGVTKSFEIKDNDKLICTFEINYPDMETLNLYLVPGGHANIRDLSKTSDGKTVINKYTLDEVSLSSTPSDPNLASISAIIDY